jgi:hypothetical protein
VDVCVSDDEAENLEAQHLENILREYITQTPETEVSNCIVEVKYLTDATIIDGVK